MDDAERRARAATEQLRERRSAVRDPGATLVPTSSGGDSIPWEEPEEGTTPDATQHGRDYRDPR